MQQTIIAPDVELIKALDNIVPTLANLFGGDTGFDFVSREGHSILVVTKGRLGLIHMRKLKEYGLHIKSIDLINIGSPNTALRILLAF